MDALWVFGRFVMCTSATSVTLYSDLHSSAGVALYDLMVRLSCDHPNSFTFTPGCEHPLGCAVLESVCDGPFVEAGSIRVSLNLNAFPGCSCEGSVQVSGDVTRVGAFETFAGLCLDDY